MATARSLYVNADGSLQRFAAADTLQIDNIDVIGTGHMTVGASLGAGDELQLGPTAGASGTGDVRVKSDLRVDNDLYVTGSSAVTVDETVTGTFNANGDVNLGTGDDTINLGGGAGDTLNMLADLVVGVGTRTIGSSVTDFLDDIWLDVVAGTANAAVALNATGNDASGTHAIGVYTAGFANISPGTDDLQTVLEAIDTAIGSGGATLQSAYAAGNTIAVTTANGSIQVSNSADVTNLLDLSRTFAGAGDAVQVQMGPGNEAVTGIGVDVSSGTGATGDLLFVNNLGSGAALRVQDGSGDVLVVDAAGAVDITATSGQDITITATGGGAEMIISAVSGLTIDCTSAGISIDADAGSNFSCAGGDLTFDAAAGEVYLDDVGNWGGTLSQSSDRTLSQTGAGEVLNGATSIIGAVNRIADKIEDEGTGQFVEYAIENAITLAAGDCVARGATAGRIQLADADGTSEQKKYVGICRTGGVGDPGGTVSATVWTAGALVTGTGYTAGSAMFVPTTPGAPSTTAPTGAGDLRQRVGWALSTTQLIADPGPRVIM